MEKALGVSENVGEYVLSENTRILIVDDNEINLSVVGGLVETLYGLECDFALSGFEAIEYVEKNKYDLILMDHMMPEIDGAETTRKIRALEKKSGDSVPIVAFTANNVDEIKDELSSAGMNDILSKPIDHKELSLVLFKWIPKEKIILKEEAPQAFCANYIQNKEVTGKTPTELATFVTLKGTENICGLDIKSGLAFVAENQEAYEKSLAIFTYKTPNTITEMENSLEKGDIKDFSIRVHGLKSSLASIGAASLSNLALDLEMMSKNGKIEDCRKKLPELITGTQKLIFDLKKFFSETPESKLGVLEVKPEEYHTRIDKIKKLYKNYDFEGYSREIEELSKFNFENTLNEKVKRLKLLVETFDYLGIGAFLDE
ncbi:MAG: response regulator [Eubacterium sp.]|jgi:CheY-like chemotaxis protein|nr:response regulator [Eubacterium sp.]